MQYYINEEQPKSLQVARSLFQVLFSQQQLQPVSILNENQLQSVIKLCSNQFHKQIQKHPKRILIFLANYHKLLHLYSLKHQTVMTNNMALHFILLLGYQMVQKNSLLEAKNIYKNVWDYVGVKGSCEKVLICLALSNLSFLYAQENKIFKGLESCLQSIQIMGEHLKQLKRENKKSQLVEDSVILINSMIQCRKLLRKIMLENKKVFYKELYHYVNQIGYKCSKKYLGKDSEFTRVFTLYESSGGLPVFKGPIDQRTSLEQKILQQLQGIYEVLKTKRQPQVVYVTQPKIIEVEKKEQAEVIIPVVQQPQVIEIKEEQQPPIIVKIQEQEQMDASAPVSTLINGWKVRAHILRPKQQSLKESNFFQEFTMGTLILQYQKGNKKFRELISSERLEKTIILIDFEQSMELDFSIRKTNDKEFIQKCVFGYIDISDEGHLKWLVKKKSLIQPFSCTFLRQQCLIFINLLTHYQFILTISEPSSYHSIHLHLSLSQKTIEQLLTIKIKTPQYISTFYQKLKQFNYAKQIEIPQKEKNTQTMVKVNNQQKLRSKLQNLIYGFQQFILEMEQQESQSYQFDKFFQAFQDQIDDNMLFTFKQIQQNPSNQLIRSNRISKSGSLNQNQANSLKGSFTVSRYLPSINSVQIYVQNNYKSFDMESQSYAKGTASIYTSKFQLQFGIPIKAFQKQCVMKSLLQNIAKRYELKVFFKPLKTHDEQLFNQNAIIESPLICRSYRRGFLKDQNGYFVPTTIAYYVITGERPFCFKIDAYFPCQASTQYTVMVNIRQSQWEKPLKESNEDEQIIQQPTEEDKSEDKQQLKSPENKYIRKRQYFISEWCQIEGYQTIFKCLKVQDLKISVQGSFSKYFSFQRLIESII